MRTVRGLVLAGLVALMGGCAIAGFLADKVVPPRVDAIYKLPDRPTAILVDDRTNCLGDPAMPGIIAVQAGSDLQQVKALTTVIDPARIVDLAARLGPKFRDMPVDQVGKAVGAQQVLYINVAQTSIEGTPGILRPTAQVYVKLVKVSDGSEIFPHLRPGSEFSGSPAEMGYPLLVRSQYKSDQDAQAIMPMLRRAMAHEIGRAVAELFYTHEPRKRGLEYQR